MSYYKRPFSKFGEKLDCYNKAHGCATIRFDEYFCKNILEKFAGFRDVRVADRPDLWCEADGKRIGIEVVSSSSSNYEQLLKFVDYRDGMLYVPGDLHEGARCVVDKFFPMASDDKRFRNLNVAELDFRRSCPVAIDEIKSAFDKKFAKLEGYKKLADCDKLDEYDLFVRCRFNVMFSSEDLNHMADYFAERGGYSTVFVFDDCSLDIFSGGTHTHVWCMDDVGCVADATVREISDIIDSCDK